MLVYEDFFLYDLENVVTASFATLFSGETKTDNKLALISPHNKLKFNLKKDAYKNNLGFELGTVYDQTSFSVTRDNVLNFGILCTKRK